MVREIRLRNVAQAEFPMFHKHVCPPKFGGGPLDPLTPTRSLKRNLLVKIKHPMIDGTPEVDMWILEDPDPVDTTIDPRGGRTFPSTFIRTVQGDIVQARTGAKGGTHTIHWHGIEPTPMNDGVGHLSFEISGNFTYQFATNEAGTYFYHCHKNTPLHFIRGLYGGLIVDPRKPAGVPDTEVRQPPYPILGPGYVACGLNPAIPELPVATPNVDGHTVIKYDREVFWVAGEMDTRWMDLEHNAFMQRCNAGNPIAARNFTQNGILNDFRPDIFHISGFAARTSTGLDRTFTGPALLNAVVNVNATVGQTVLIRQITAGFTIQQYTLPVDVIVIAADGHPHGVPPFHKYSRPFKVLKNTPFRLSSARRWDMIIPPGTPVISATASIEFLDWSKIDNATGDLMKLYTARIPVNITAAPV